ncbi:MAG: hypothetical protein CL696_01245 [Chloroflexi bacterium]|nr:hypothetical protein [Chloroflexota bacterium]
MFEKDYDNVVEATKLNALDWTMAQDNDFVTWRCYRNRFWPAKYLIDKDGVAGTPNLAKAVTARQRT